MLRRRICGSFFLAGFVIAPMLHAADGPAFPIAVTGWIPDSAVAAGDAGFVESSAPSRVGSGALRPLIVFDREWIEASGKFSVAELLRDLPMATGGSPRAVDEFLLQPVYAGIDLRRLTTDATLVLVDGRRTAAAPVLGQSTDLLGLPLAMIERIEVLAEGAAAVHGVDAAAGVVNLVTRAKFEGLELSAGRSESNEGGGGLEQASVLFGLKGERGRILIGASHDQRAARSAQQPWSFGYGPIRSLANTFGPAPGQRPFPPGVSAANIAGCQGPGFRLEAGRCEYDILSTQILEMGTRNESLFSRARFEVNDRWALFMNGRVSSTRLASQVWPTQRGGFGFGLDPGSPNHPATPPSAGGLNPLWQDYLPVADQTLSFSHVFAANGPQTRRERTEIYEVDIGVTGRLGEVELEAGVRSNESNLTALGRNNLLDEFVQARIDDGGYNLYDPLATPDEVLGSMEATASVDARWQERSVWATARVAPFELPAGPARASFGVEFRDLDSRIEPDALSGALVISSLLPQLRTAEAKRQTASILAEFDLPIFDTVTTNLAARWDDSDDLGSVLNARVAFGWTPFQWLDTRVSWSRSGLAAPVTQDFQFRSLSFETGPPSFSDDGICRQLGVDSAPCSVDIVGERVINPDLEHAVSTQIGLGITMRPVKGVRIAVDGFDLELKDRFTRPGSPLTLLCWLGQAPGISCPDRVATLPADFGPDDGVGVFVQPGGTSFGALAFVQEGLVNAGSLDVRGIDLLIAGEWTTGYGAFQTDLLATWTDRYRFNGIGNSVGGTAIPEWRAQWVNRAHVGDFRLSWFATWIGTQPNGFSALEDGVPSWVTHDVQLAWETPWRGTVMLGADNLTDREPPRFFSGFADHETRLYDDYGRLGYVRYVQRF